MSYRAPATVPTPAPVSARPRRSFGFYVLLLVGFFALLILLGIGAFALALANETKKPFEKTATLAFFKDLPTYDGAILDEEISKSQRLPLYFLKNEYPSDKQSVIAYRTRSQPDFILAWFDKEMTDRGYKIEAESEHPDLPLSAHTHRYIKGDDLVIVQAQRANDDKDSAFVMMRFSGYKPTE